MAVRKQIFNIFLKSKGQKDNDKKEEREKVKIIVDYREKNSLIISELISLGINPEIKELKVADYIVQGTVIERKTVADFISSMINHRLLRQLEELKQYPERLLVLEGIEEQNLYTDSEEEREINPNAIRGFILSILLKHKVPIVFTKNYQDTAKFLYILAKKKPKDIPLNVNKKTLDKKERIQFILEGFPGIGPKTAKKLLKKFKTIKNVINADQEELKDVLGKKTETFFNLINQRY